MFKRRRLSMQKELRQLEGIPLDKRFIDKASGKDLHRPELVQLTSYVRDGDTVVCHSMDRLARNLDDLRKIVLGFIDRGVHVRFEKENLTFTGRIHRCRICCSALWEPSRNSNVT